MRKIDESAARVMVYFNVGVSEKQSTNITIRQLKAHLSELFHGEYNVLPLSDIVANI